jgi:hypothetical protein
MPSKIEDYAIIGDTKTVARHESTPVPRLRRCWATLATDGG